MSVSAVVLFRLCKYFIGDLAWESAALGYRFCPGTDTLSVLTGFLTVFDPQFLWLNQNANGEMLLILGSYDICAEV